MKGLLNSVIFFLLLLHFSACEKENMGDCFKSTGDQILEERLLSPIKRLRIDDNIEVTICYSTQQKITVEAGENIIDEIITEVDGDRLLIRNDNRCNWVRSFKRKKKVHLSLPQLTEIRYYGSGTVNFSEEFPVDTFELEMWRASGDLNLKLSGNYISLKSHTGPGVVNALGTAEELITYINGLGYIDCLNLKAKKVLAVNSNTGELSVNCEEQLKADISGSGNIFYLGNPLITLNNNGSGKLIKK